MIYYFQNLITKYNNMEKKKKLVVVIVIVAVQIYI